MADYLIDKIKGDAIFNGKRCKIAVLYPVKVAEKSLNRI